MLYTLYFMLERELNVNLNLDNGGKKSGEVLQKNPTGFQYALFYPLQVAVRIRPTLQDARSSLTLTLKSTYQHSRQTTTRLPPHVGRIPSSGKRKGRKRAGA